jgi:hypothetical protein
MRQFSGLRFGARKGQLMPSWYGVVVRNHFTEVLDRDRRRKSVHRKEVKYGCQLNIEIIVESTAGEGVSSGVVLSRSVAEVGGIEAAYGVKIGDVVLEKSKQAAVVQDVKACEKLRVANGVQQRMQQVGPAGSSSRGALGSSSGAYRSVR